VLETKLKLRFGEYMYKKMNYYAFWHETLGWIRAWELLGRRSWRLAKRVFNGLLLLAETVLSGRKLRRSVAPGKYEAVENRPASYYSHFTHPPNLN
jgi:hypothetical protein